MELRPVGGSAAEVSDGGVGVCGGTSSGVVPEDTRNWSESGVGGRPKWRAAESVITDRDESRNTGDESPGGSGKDVDSHT